MLRKIEKYGKNLYLGFYLDFKTDGVKNWRLNGGQSFILLAFFMEEA